jgi:hypothetical protein
MLETPHVAVGIAIATKFPNPWVAIPLCLASHFILDKIPHWNPHTYTETMKNGKPSKDTFTLTVADATLALSLGLVYASNALPDIAFAATILASCFASVAPDVSKYPFFLIKTTRHGIYRKWVEYERKLQTQIQSVFWGITTQVLTIAAALYTLRF